MTKQVSTRVETGPVAVRVRRRLPVLPGGNDEYNCAGAMGKVPGFPDWKFWMQNFLEGEHTAPCIPGTHRYFYFMVQRVRGECSQQHVLGPYVHTGTWEWAGGWHYFAAVLGLCWPRAWVAHAEAQPELTARFHALARRLERAVFQEALDTAYGNLGEGWKLEVKPAHVAPVGVDQAILMGQGGRTWGPFVLAGSALKLASGKRPAPGTLDVVAAASVRGHWNDAPVQVLEKLWHRLMYPPPVAPLGPLYAPTPRTAP